jgi:molybdopterin converting factor subunit 1
MRLSILLFASYAEALGGPTVELDLPDDATVATAVGALRARPGAGRLPARPLVAVNQEYADWDRRLDAADEVAIIPPVAGG